MKVDLRSDTVTKPTKGMMDAMFSAEVGDDVFGEDPTVNALEEKSAAMFGAEAGLFCPSGTMTNQIAIRAHANPLDEIICDAFSHIYNYEAGGYASNAGVSIKLAHTKNGILKVPDILLNIQPDQDWLPITKMVCIENTVNRAGGVCYSLNEIQELSRTCKETKLVFHLDGARIFNALEAKGNQPLELKNLFHSISVCLSKGLGTPVGSVLLGSKAFIKKCRRIRKVMGGGMRQAGILAAAGIYALDNHISRLREDHERATVLANELSTLSYISNLVDVETNIIIFDLEGISSRDFVSKLEENGILSVPFGPKTIRLVTHLDFNDDQLDHTVKVLRNIA